MFCIGDRVVLYDGGCPPAFGSVGTVVYQDEYEVGVDFDLEFFGGHSCSGHARDGHGWYVVASKLSLIDEGQDEMIPPTDEEIFSLFQF
jgi:hypothetical protein